MSAGTPAVNAILLANLLQDKLQVTQSASPSQDEYTSHGHIEEQLSAAECHPPLSFNNPPGRASNFDGNGRRVGTKCGHLLHPKTDYDDEYCPVCRVVAYLNLLRRITKDWDGKGGPWRPLTGQSTEDRDAYCHIWHKRRLELAQLVMRYEEDAENEERWEQEHTGEVVEAARKTCSAGNAVVISRAMSRYPTSVRTGNIADPDCRSHAPTMLPSATTNHHTPSSKAKAPKTRRVQFASDTNFKISRPRASFHRSTKGYVPGKHAAPSSSTLLNTSNMLVKRYNVRQLKIIREFDCPWNIELVDAIAQSNHEGIAELHPRWPEIGDKISRIHDGKDEVPNETFMKSLSTADYLLVKTDEKDQVTHVTPYTTRDIENIPGDGAGEVRIMENKGWTSHMEIMSDECRDEIWNTYECAGGATRTESNGRK